jgi:hypothetical protein
LKPPLRIMAAGDSHSVSRTPFRVPIEETTQPGVGVAVAPRPRLHNPFGI